MKAVLYARVSSELQKKERTIESQIIELKTQIKDAGDVLVKEYVDDGYSGARLDRPALDELRRDLKTPLFDSIYFLNTDRIARDVTYQIIIISEILKQRKQLIINGPASGDLSYWLAHLVNDLRQTDQRNQLFLQGRPARAGQSCANASTGSARRSRIRSKVWEEHHS